MRDEGRSHAQSITEAERFGARRCYNRPMSNSETPQSENSKPARDAATSHARYWHPRHWPSQLGILLIRLASRVPWRLLLPSSVVLLPFVRIFLSKRLAISKRNLELCFPTWSESKRKAVLRANARDLGNMLSEFAIAWMANDKNIDAIPHRITGLEHLAEAKRAGRGVILVGAHFSHLELAGRLLTRKIELAGMYRQHGDPAFENAIRQARLRYATAMFKREDLRATVKHLKSAGVLWYAPDQSMRGKDRCFVPFFGINAATITATHHLARLSGAVVIGFFHRRLPAAQGYEIHLEAPLENFPSKDVEYDTMRVNQMIERMVIAAPEQYLWIHKRFKTRPAGETPLY